MGKLKRITFSKMTHWLDGTKRADDWPGYIGGDIPAGLAVSRVARLDDPTVNANGWTVSHIQSGYAVDRTPYLRTRKLAIEWAEALGKIAERFAFSWDVDRGVLVDSMWRNGTYSDIHGEIDRSIRTIVEKSKN